MSAFRALAPNELPSLDLPNMKVIEARESDDLYVLKIRHTVKPIICPKCTAVFSLKGHGRLKQKISDVPIRDKHVRLIVERKRSMCLECGATSMEELPWLHDERRATDRLVKAIERDCGFMPHTHIAHRYGVDDKTVKNILDSLGWRLDRQMPFITPEWLGIDELKLGDTYRAVFTNIRQSTMINILNDRLKDTIVTFLRKLDAPTVQVVTMDMWRPYRDAVREVLPEATVTVDKFHVVRLANECLETVRKGHRQELTKRRRKMLREDRKTLLKRRKRLSDARVAAIDGWRAEFPELIADYELKERFYGIYDASTAEEARRRYARWLSSVYLAHGPTGGPWVPLISAMTNWEDEIMSYFDQRATNAFAESMNRIIRGVDDMGRGYSMSTLRIKLIIRQLAPKQGKLASRSKQANGAFGDGIPQLMTLESMRRLFDEMVPMYVRENEFTYGADLDQVADLLEALALKHRRRRKGNP